MFQPKMSVVLRLSNLVLRNSEEARDAGGGDVVRREVEYEVGWDRGGGQVGEGLGQCGLRLLPHEMREAIGGVGAEDACVLYSQS